jgi:RNA-binding protein
MSPLNNAKIRELKARAQLMKPSLKIGKDGLTPQFIAEVDAMFGHHDLLKIKFADHKEEKKVLGPQLAEKTSSQLIMQVGHVVVIYRPLPVKADAEEPEQ